ncbi:branched-chain amino acid ABC transporter permease [Candidatus Poriferisodalis sp.]|uniref:branched-chain amino acid ABC transporter permease n=1 Tax=Candidatus Poriferisodalis sp. TaxID=3101277 RepID=UPI003B02E1AC
MDSVWSELPQFIINGLRDGAVFAAVALALVLIFKATTLINFATGELAMIGAFFAYVLNIEQGLWLWLSILIAMLISAVIGAGVERALVRPFDPDDHLPVVLITLGLFLILNAMAGDIWDYQLRAVNDPFGTFPSWVPFGSELKASSDGTLSCIENSAGDLVEVAAGTAGAETCAMVGRTDWGVWQAKLPYQTIGIWATLGLALVALAIILGKSKAGLAFRAVSSNAESARLVGVNTGRTLGFGWALASMFGTLGAALVAPSFSGVNPNMMAFVLIYALAGAALGGLDSLGGAVIGGLAVGLIKSVLVYWLGVRVLGQAYFEILELAMAFLLILIVLLFRPAGLFGTRRIERV